jgi:uncharacterized protein (DUF983 family)
MNFSHEELQEIFKTYKKCPRCSVVKNYDEGFYKSRSECKSCRGGDLKKRRDLIREKLKEETN